MKKLFLISLVSLGALLAATVAKAQNNVPPAFSYTPRFSTLTSSPAATVPVLTTNAPVSIEVPAECVVVLSSTISGGAAATNGSAILSARGSLDGVNWPASYAYNQTCTLSGTNWVTTITALVTNPPYRFLSWDKSSNDHTNSVTIQSMTVSFIPYRR